MSIFDVFRGAQIPAGHRSVAMRIVLRAHDRTLTESDAAEVRERYAIPANVLERLAEIGVLTPSRRGYATDDVKIIEAISRFRAGGYDEALGFTVYDTLRYREALEPLEERFAMDAVARVATTMAAEQARD